MVDANPDRPAIPHELVREQLQKLLSSPHLAHSERLTKLLRFVVEETLQQRAAGLKESRLGLEVFGRPVSSYDPAIDPIVRVQMGRLRVKLRDYYANQGSTDRVLIDIPKGNYVPSFTRRQAASRESLDVKARVQTAEPRPYSESLARATASSPSRARITAATGPNVSSRNTGMAGVTPVSTMGRK